MFTFLAHLLRRLALAAVLLSIATLGFGADEPFEEAAKRIFVEMHATHYQTGNIEACVALYARDAKFFVGNKLIATGEKELLAFYKDLRDVDQIRNRDH